MLQQRLLETCRAGGVRLLGPNCMGVINPRNRMVLSSSISATVGELPVPGRIGFVSQSGALMVSMFDYARAVGVPLGPCVSVGNQADVEICDIIEALAADPAIDAVCVYAEGFRDPRRFLRAAQACRAGGTALFLTKAGRTEAGAKAALSHTASLAGSYAVTAAICRENGVALAREPISMLMAAALMSGRSLPRTDGVAICSGSGGAISIAVDEITGPALRLAELSEATEAALSAHVHRGHTQNPIDLGFRRVGNPIAAAGPIMEAIANDKDVGAVLLLLGSVPGLEAMTQALLAPIIAADRTPVVVVDAGEMADGARRATAGLGCPAFPDLELALRSLRLLNALSALQQQGDSDNEAAGDRAVGAAPAREAADLDGALGALPDGYVTEFHAKAVLRLAGVDSNPGEVMEREEDAVAVAKRIGYPVVLKVASSDVVHKSASGGVRLNIADAEQLRLAWSSIPAGPIYVQQMVRGAVAELLVGLRIDAEFGPVVVVASGGVLTEVLDDAQLATAPVSRPVARRLLQGLRTWPMLDRLRKTDGVDIEAIVTVIERMGRLASRARGRLVDLEINPLLVLPRGAAPVAVDARANVAPPAAAESDPAPSAHHPA